MLYPASFNCKDRIEAVLNGLLKLTLLLLDSKSKMLCSSEVK